MTMGFRKDFVWGSATSSFQIEGARNEDGRTDSVWDRFCDEGNTFRGHNGNVACDHYHRYVGDVALMKELGLKAYRFSVSWARVMPDGEHVNEKGLDFYGRLIDELLKNGVEPYLTMYHWDTPAALHERGGWLNRDITDRFGDYADVLVKRFGDRVTHFITINEPQCLADIAYGRGTHAPGYRLSAADRFRVSHNVLLAHGKAVSAVRRRKTATAGIAMTGDIYCPETPADYEAAELANFSLHEGNEFFSHYLFSEAVYNGAYPADAADRYRCDPVRSGDMEIISQPLEMYYMNVYTGHKVRAAGDGFVETEPEVGYPRTATNWRILPQVLYYAPKMFSARYGKPIFVSENGMASCDRICMDGKVHDSYRIDYLWRHIRELKRAAEEGVDVRGYFQWSFMDNFEWNEGYNMRFGMVYIDYTTQERTPKDSAYWYRDVMATNAENL